MSQLEGVYSVHEPHFWTLCSDVYCGALKLEVGKGADHKYIQSSTHNIFTAVRTPHTHPRTLLSSSFQTQLTPMYLL